MYSLCTRWIRPALPAGTPWHQRQAAWLAQDISGVPRRSTADARRAAPGSAHDILTDLESAAVDLTLTSRRPDEISYAWHTVEEGRLVMIVPPSHRWATRSRMDLTDALDEEFVTTPTGFGYRDETDALLRAAGVTQTILFECQDLATIEGPLAAGMGIAIVPEHIAGASGINRVGSELGLDHV